MSRLINHETTTTQAARILPCSCENAYQDATYGAGNRVHNAGKTAYRCAVCCREKPLSKS